MRATSRELVDNESFPDAMGSRLEGFRETISPLMFSSHESRNHTLMVDQVTEEVDLILEVFVATSHAHVFANFDRSLIVNTKNSWPIQLDS